MSESGKSILRFDNVSFAYNEGKHIILEDASFNVRENTKITIMGQNGAGKSTMFKLILGELKPRIGKINLDQWAKVAISRQVIPREMMELSVTEYFATAFDEKDYQLDRKVENVLQEVNLLWADVSKPLHTYSGGQQARLLLAHALIQEPDILLLDEPTNNLDAAGIGDLITFLLSYEKTVIVISHDADFLNMFTDWVLYLNRDRKLVEQYRGDYYDVVEQIQAAIEKEKKQNARMEKKIEDAKDKINFFSNKWGKMRKIAKKMKAEIEEAEDNTVEVRKDDKTIAPFAIEFENFVGPIVSITSLSLMWPEYKPVQVPFELVIKKKQRILLEWPNGIGKTTLLKRLVNDASDSGAVLAEEIRVGYYSQDFNALDMNMVVRDALHEVTNEATDQDVYRVASRFLLTGELLKQPIYTLSEWQKWLLCYARFVLQKPHLLILDEPTNHINFRHLPVIAEWLNKYEWAILMVSHDEHFLSQLDRIERKELGRLVGR